MWTRHLPQMATLKAWLPQKVWGVWLANLPSAFHSHVLRVEV